LGKSIQRYAENEGAPVDVLDFKLPHHGSFSNLSKNLIKAVRPERYLCSSSRQYYEHPDNDTIELILKHHEGGTPHLVFNYLSPKTKPWVDSIRQEERGYEALFPGGASRGAPKN
jgi:hypothetical protein